MLLIISARVLTFVYLGFGQSCNCWQMSRPVEASKPINLRYKAKKDCHSTDYAKSRLNVIIRSSPMPVIYKPLWGTFDETGDWHPSYARQNLVSGFSKRPKDFSNHGSTFFSLNVLLTTFDQDKCFLIYFLSQFYFYLK